MIEEISAIQAVLTVNGWIWASTMRMTVLVQIREGRVVKAPPIVAVFVTQPVANLIRWMNKQPSLLLATFP